ncbi:serine/threonine protein kinase [Lyngbya confervoides]|uniref:non-specific serine/threonine protein kinase n=1 Tax=Lyngbya confervoides BDU141951 TaxID=1574623 RepID=A0ABD4T642_9CYAN|nr:serine/threonine-protein kinase [Lyngbya confervoides]MCM1983908.1 serine/threonine protein kinase [Lyngbya confervoides BDU141951]
MLLQHRFQIHRLLYQGGFGTTFLAVDTHTPSRRLCVVKQFCPALPNQPSFQIALRKFQEEAAVLERLDHPQIPRLYGYFEHQGQFYLSQQWIEGQTLGSCLAQGPMPEIEVIRILSQLLPVFEYLHAHQVIHRDVKPDNIILRDGDRCPVLIDFGSVKQHGQAAVHPSQGVACSVVIGTEGFVSPEQVAQRVSYASDLYSLGITAICMLTGKMPHEIPLHPQTGQFLWTSLVPGVSLALQALLNKAIAFDPCDRYGSATQMLAALRAIASQPPPITVLEPNGVKSGHPGQAVRIAPAAARRLRSPSLPLSVAGLAMVLSGLFSFQIGVTVTAHRSDPAPSEITALEAALQPDN